MSIAKFDSSFNNIFDIVDNTMREEKIKDIENEITEYLNNITKTEIDDFINSVFFNDYMNNHYDKLKDELTASLKNNNKINVFFDNKELEDVVINAIMVVITTVQNSYVLFDKFHFEEGNQKVAENIGNIIREYYKNEEIDLTEQFDLENNEVIIARINEIKEIINNKNDKEEDMSMIKVVLKWEVFKKFYPYL